jgi:hypothetical protein
MGVSPTSAKVYHDEIKGEKEESQDHVIYKAMQKFCNPVTARQIQKVTGLEINVVSRSVNNLCKKKEMIELYFTAKCPITGRKVAHYKPKEL